jgi:hypothetical protein
MQLVFTLSGLLALGAPGATSAPHLARLVAASGAPRREPDGLAAALAACYGITRQEDWPLAPVRLAALGIDPGAAYWLAADPVTLVAGRDDVRLTGAVGDLTTVEAAALLDTLNAHFSGDDLVFAAPRPDAWFVRAPGRPALVNRPLASVAGHTLRALLPSGADAGKWRRWQNEIQMLLHEHPVNAARERAGRPPANSVWFSCGGTPPERNSDTLAIRTFANDGIATELAAYFGAPARALPERLRDIAADATSSGAIVVAFDAPLDLDDIEASWAPRAWTMLTHGKLDAVTVIADGDGSGAAVWTARAPGLWQRIAGSVARPSLAALVAAARIEP